MKSPRNVSAAVALAVALLGGGVGVAQYGVPKTGLEGREVRPYLDVAGIWTDCYGNTKKVSRNVIRSEEECRALLGGEAVRIAKKIDANSVVPLSTEMLASFISFAYNVGDAAFFSSTLWRMASKGEYANACAQMWRWTYITVANEKVFSTGLYNRRKIEVQICVEGLGK